MLTQEENDLLARVDPGTPCGELLRRYWQPVVSAGELTSEHPKKRVRILGEDLVLYRDPDGGYGLIAEHCAHRGCSLYYGFLEDGGIRCAYHGWLYDRAGKCLEQPFEPAESMMKYAVRQPAYPVERLAGLLFAYLGPQPAPLLPRWDHLVRDGGRRRLEVHPIIDCNWLQCQENSIDPVHTHYLHAHTFWSRGLPGGEYHHRPIEKFEFEMTEWGIFKRRTFGGDQPEQEVGHLALFPNMLRHPASLHWRVPIDDTHTQIFQMLWRPSTDPATPPEEGDPPVDYITVKNEQGEFHMENFPSQDEMAWETQGQLADRTRERLGASDRGIAMWRQLLKEQIEAVHRGDDPIALVRDPAKNEIVWFETSSATRRDEYAEALRNG
ncbi:MAG: Aromatic ring-hydroxylating dioxygenase subunit alpha [Chloroflexi bacterium]|nr:Aromatic ring-hydroxylating dioxygenase subunit alpha [Chloroflexota bacterium]